jgi:chitodextrinase
MICSLLLMLGLVVLAVPSSVFAASTQLMRGYPVYSVDVWAGQDIWFDQITAVGPTDGNSTDGSNIPGGGRHWIKLNGVANVDSYKISANTSDSTALSLLFYDSNKNLIKTMPVTDTGYYLHTFPVINNVLYVALVNNLGTTVRDNEWELTGAQPPANVTGLTSVPGVEKVSLSWINPSSDPIFSGVNIYKDGVKINSGLITGTSYDVTGLVSERSYDLVVRSSDASGVESAGSSITVSPNDTTAPPIPLNLTGVADTGLINFSWSHSVPVHNDLSGYKVYKDGLAISGLITDNILQVVASDYEVNHKYNVTAIDLSGNESAYSNDLNIAAWSPEVKPTLSYTSTNSTITLNWDAVGVSYEVWNTFQGTNYKLLNTSGTTYTVTNLDPSSESEYYVVAKDSHDRMVPSISIVAKTQDLPMPVKPVIAGTVDVNFINLQWQSLGSSYDVFSVVSGTNTKLVTQSGTFFKATGLSPNTDYTYFVSYIDQYGRTVASDPYTFKTLDLPSTVAPVLSSTGNTFDTVSLRWNSVGQSYEIFKDNVYFGSTVGTSFTVNNLINSTSYDFKVVALDAYGRKIDSNIVNVTTAVLPETNKPVLNKIALTHNSVKIIWNDVGSSNYVVLRDGVEIGSATSISFQSNGLTPVTSYQYQVKYTDKYGRSVTSDQLTVTTLSEPPPAPTPAPAEPPPSVVHSNNPDLNNAGDHLVQGVKDMNKSGGDITAIVIGVIILVFFSLWIWHIIKRNMSRNAVSKQGGHKGSASTKKGISARTDKPLSVAKSLTSPAVKFSKYNPKNQNPKFRKRYKPYEKPFYPKKIR